MIDRISLRVASPPNEPHHFPQSELISTGNRYRVCNESRASSRSNQQSRCGGGPVKLGDFTRCFHDLFTKEMIEKSADLNAEAIAGTNAKLPSPPLPCFAPKPLPLSKAPETLELQAEGLSRTPATRRFIRDCKFPAVTRSLNQQSPLPTLHRG